MIEIIRCPKCGEPPWYFIGTFYVRVGLRTTGEGMELTGEKRVCHPIPGHPMYGECGGGHRWEIDEKVFPSQK